jgi:hypothetical protein
MTLSIPMFSVSVFPTMQSSLGLIPASLSASSTLPSVETATGQPGPSQKEKNIRPATDVFHSIEWVP